MIEIIFIIIAYLPPIILLITLYKIYRGRKDRELKDFIIALTRKHGKVTLDDIVVETHISRDKILKLVNDLIADNNLRKIEEKDTVYYTLL